MGKGEPVLKMDYLFIYLFLSFFLYLFILFYLRTVVDFVGNFAV